MTRLPGGADGSEHGGGHLVTKANPFLARLHVPPANGVLRGCAVVRVPGAGRHAGYHEPGRDSPYQDSMIRCAMDTGGGSSISPVDTAARNCSRENHRASAISSPSTWISCWP